MNAAQTSPGLPVRTWRDLWAFVMVIAMLVASFTILQVQSSQNTQSIQELKQDKLDKEAYHSDIDDVKERLVRIERKIDAESELQHKH